MREKMYEMVRKTPWDQIGIFVKMFLLHKFPQPMPSNNYTFGDDIRRKKSRWNTGKLHGRIWLTEGFVGTLGQGLVNPPYGNPVIEQLRNC